MPRSKRQAIHSAAAPQVIGPYSQAIVSGNTVYVSGQLPINPDTHQITGTIQEQTVQCLMNINEILHELEMNLSHVVKSTVILSDMNDFEAFNKVYAEYFYEPYPARVTFGGQLIKDAKLQIEVVAIK
ncbi:Rid family detoxifying hydrolase [Fundicoccus culcitae]|uniref:Rid family detoxifying hydrolase n=1 Tax=Fundicoccus culcitae TaxID=2969821 RepID=A0ABY5P7E6_9LACT|nr:Rid family detoxifying hydrolase [Fundicoccus culcitae]UUX34661.1 Rid family detoxifying hydrolase [Fundicoccus culcitae]